MALYIPPFLIALAFCLGSISLFLLLPFFRKSEWRQGLRHRDKAKVPRLGGVALIIAFSLAVFLDPHLVLTKEIIGLIVCSLLILFFGLWDDFFEADWKLQLFFQVALVVAIFLFGVRILSVTNPFGGAWFFTSEALLLPSFLLLLAWVLLVLNAVNWLDGLDGLLGGVSFLVFLTMFLLSLQPEVNQPPIAILALAGAGAAFGFLLFNFFPARILAGTTGALFLGFLVAILAVIAGTKIATALLVLSLPIADALWVILKRLRSHTSIFQPDMRHLHYRLQALGWSEKRIAWSFYGVTTFIAGVALSTQALGKFAALILVLGTIFSFLFFVEVKTRTLERNKDSVL
ncbi:MAG: hypothetical protein A2808_01335 [Candidatus Moranbacteria bacterium RIFCSPHIGHO2_01_FULL_55_24]|nr:MAG: hypothetical protein A2808_01335 [Candidatus Moranbacteria bacterium RIFCSPHIGHO2_01_FULL_55_24]